MDVIPKAWEIHPALVHFPIGLLIAAVFVDLFIAPRRERYDLVVDALLVGGLASGVVAASTGALAYATVLVHTDAAHPLMKLHLGLALTSLGLFGVYALWRRRSRRAAGRPAGASRILGIVGALFLTATGYLGGHVVYRGAAGIDPALLSDELRGGHTHGGGEEGAPAAGGHGGHGEAAPAMPGGQAGHGEPMAPMPGGHAAPGAPMPGGQAAPAAPMPGGHAHPPAAATPPPMPSATPMPSPAAPPADLAPASPVGRPKRPAHDHPTGHEHH